MMALGSDIVLERKYHYLKRGASQQYLTISPVSVDLSSNCGNVILMPFSGSFKKYFLLSFFVSFNKYKIDLNEIQKIQQDT